MTYDHDPARWTSSPDDAPELLRGAFAAARNEGPNRGQMRALAVKLAAASAGGAVAVGTVKAASAGNAIATAATWSATKIAGVIALAGGVVAGAVVWHQQPSAVDPAHSKPSVGAVSSTSAADTTVEAAALPARPAAEPRVREPSVIPLAEQPPPAQAAGTASATPSRATDPVESNAMAVESNAKAAVRAPSSGSRVASAQVRPGLVHTKQSARNVARMERQAAVEATDLAPATSAAQTPAIAGVRRQAPSAADTRELELLQQAQAALRSRPREAFQLTQKHRRLYPDGEFAQERDALAIQALMRAGDTENARNLAEAFVRSYPSSPHAHRFREAMGIR